MGHKSVDDLLQPLFADQLLKLDGRRRDVDELEHATLLLVNGIGSLLDLVEVSLLYLIRVNRRTWIHWRKNINLVWVNFLGEEVLETKEAVGKVLVLIVGGPCLEYFRLKNTSLNFSLFFRQGYLFKVLNLVIYIEDRSQSNILERRESCSRG